MSDWETLRAERWLNHKLETPLMVRYWDTILQQNFEKPHAWDYLWTLATWRYEGLHVTPNLNLVSNIGFRSDASHTVDLSDPFSNLPARSIEFPLKHPPAVIRDAEADLITEQKAYSGKDFLKLMFSATRQHIQTQK